MSCATQRTNTRTAEKVRALQQRDSAAWEHHTALRAVSDTAALRLAASGRKDTKQDEEIITTVEVFDTTQPVDERTGTPPLKSRTTQSRRTLTQQSREQQFSAEANSRQESADTVATTRTTNVQQQAATDTTTSVDSKHRRGLNGPQRFLCTLGLCLLLVGGGWLAWRIFKH